MHVSTKATTFFTLWLSAAAHRSPLLQGGEAMEQPSKKQRCYSAAKLQERAEKAAARGYGPGGQPRSRSQLVAQAQQAQQQTKTQRQAAAHMHAAWSRECDEHDRTKQVSDAPDTDTRHPVPFDSLYTLFCVRFDRTAPSSTLPWTTSPACRRRATPDR